MSKKPPKGPGKPPPKRPGGKPPVEHQFKPGQSGNPGGRPKKRPTMRDALHDALDRIVTVPLDGRPQQMPMRDALAHKTLAGAGNDLDAFTRLMRWLEGDAAAASTEPEDATGFNPAEDEEIYRAAIERGRRRSEDPSDGEDEDE